MAIATLTIFYVYRTIQGVYEKNMFYNTTLFAAIRLIDYIYIISEDLYVAILFFVYIINPINHSYRL